MYVTVSFFVIFSPPFLTLHDLKHEILFFFHWLHFSTVQLPESSKRNFGLWSSLMSNGSREQTDKQVKVTVIETQFVRTDEASFKSVVHQFTGKDSKIGIPPRTSPIKPQVQRLKVPATAQSQMEVACASGASEASRAQNGMVDREEDFMEGLEPFLNDLYELIDS
jgi:VQ motif